MGSPGSRGSERPGPTTRWTERVPGCSRRTAQPVLHPRRSRQARFVRNRRHRGPHGGRLRASRGWAAGRSCSTTPCHGGHEGSAARTMRCHGTAVPRGGFPTSDRRCRRSPTARPRRPAPRPRPGRRCRCRRASSRTASQDPRRQCPLRSVCEQTTVLTTSGDGARYRRPTWRRNPTPPEDGGFECAMLSALTPLLPKTCPADPIEAKRTT